LRLFRTRIAKFSNFWFCNLRRSYFVLILEAISIFATDSQIKKILKVDQAMVVISVLPRGWGSLKKESMKNRLYIFCFLFCYVQLFGTNRTRGDKVK
jgi:uncharacterized membrane protein YjdF